MHHFRGWVPTITGKLSFSQIGLCKDNRISSNVYNNLSQGGLLIAKHTRTSIDGPIASFFQQLVLRRNPNQYFIVQGGLEKGHMLQGGKDANGLPKWSPDSRAILTGKIFVYVPPPFGIPKIKKTPFQNALEAFNKEMSYAQSLLTDGTELERRDWVEHLSANCNNSKLTYEANFSINRNGTCTIEMLEKGYLRNNSNPNDFRVLANQMMFCLRDIIHRHYHHDASEELSSIAYPVIDNKKYDDSTWRRETLYGLTRLALQARRNSSIRESKNAIGILAYADSFQSHLADWCETRRRSSQTHKPNVELINSFSSYDFQAMVNSLKASISTKEWKRSRTMSIIVVCTAIFALMTSITFGMFRLKYQSLPRNESLKIDGILEQAITLITTNPLVTSIIVPLALIFPFYIWAAEWNFKRVSELRIHRLENAVLKEIFQSTKRPTVSWAILIIINCLLIFGLIKVLLLLWNNLIF